jgi:hypothetical protein
MANMSLRKMTENETEAERSRPPSVNFLVGDDNKPASRAAPRTSQAYRISFQVTDLPE